MTITEKGKINLAAEHIYYIERKEENGGMVMPTEVLELPLNHQMHCSSIIYFIKNSNHVEKNVYYIINHFIDDKMCNRS